METMITAKPRVTVQSPGSGTVAMPEPIICVSEALMEPIEARAWELWQCVPAHKRCENSQQQAGDNPVSGALRFHDAKLAKL